MEKGASPQKDLIAGVPFGDGTGGLWAIAQPGSTCGKQHLDLHEPGYSDLWHPTALAPFGNCVSKLYIMAVDRDEDAPSRSQSESSDDSDSLDSDDMRTTITGKVNDDKVKKAANKDPNRIKRKKARRACENCQRAHLTCSKSILPLATHVPPF